MTRNKALLAKFASEVANLTADGDLIRENDGELTEYEMENDDAWSTLNGLIHEARAMLNAPKWTLRSALSARASRLFNSRLRGVKL